MTHTRDQEIDDHMSFFPGWSREQVADHLDERNRDYQRDVGSRQGRAICIAHVRARAAEFGQSSAVVEALQSLANDFEKLNPRSDHIDGVYGAYLEAYRAALTGGSFTPSAEVFSRAAATIGAMDGKHEPPAGLRTRVALFEAVAGLLQRRE